MKVGCRAIKKNEREQILKELKVYGYCVVEGFINAESIGFLKGKVEEFCGERATYEGLPDRDAEDRVVYNLQNKDRVFIDLLSHDDLHSILMEKLNDPYYRYLPQDAPNYFLHYYNARSSGQKLDLHIDSNIPFLGERSTMMQTAILLDDSEVENGCTIVVPGSHMTGEFTDRGLENVKMLSARAGDMVMWDSRLWHGACENVSKKSRWSLIATWGMWWIKPSMDMTRSLPEDVYVKLDERQKQMLGFCCIPPADEYERINTKSGYDSLRKSVEDYYNSRCDESKG